MTRVKICCIGSIEEAELAVRHGAHALGLVSWMPSGPGVIPDARIRDIAAAVPPGIHTFLLTCRRDPDEIAAQQCRAGVDTVQLVDRMSVADLVALRTKLPGISLIQVVHVTGEGAIAEARRVEPYVDAILLDSGTPDAARRELGGTGRVHDWSISTKIVRNVASPVFLAGGLGPDNVAEAIRRVRPHGVDVCSGLRPRGHLDEALLGRFFRAVRDASADPGGSRIATGRE
ncbi:MAG: phosphoribosylanthranilate isomerase [Gemmatimonadota bacterium]